MGDRAAKDALYDGLAAAAKALANGRRAEIVDLVAQGERSVDEIAGEIGQSVANTSQHLQHLLRAGLVRTRRDGTRIYYALASDQVAVAWALLRDIARDHLGEIDRLAAAYLGERSTLDTISRPELARRPRQRDVVVLDVRPPAEYAAGHIAGAVSVPIADIRRRLRELPADADIVVARPDALCAGSDGSSQPNPAHNGLSTTRADARA